MNRTLLRKQQDMLFHVDAAPPPAKKRDFRIEVSIVGRDMAASVKVIPLGEGCGVTVFDILARLYRSGVSMGIDYDLIADIVTGKRFHEEIPVAFGMEPAKGADAMIEPRVMLEEFTTAQMLRQFPGQVIRNGVPVDIDEVIAEKRDAEPGMAGFTVRGRRIEPQAGQDVRFEFGEGVALSRDGRQLLAAMPGMAGLADGLVCVKDAEYEAWKYDVKIRKQNMEAVLTIVPGLTQSPEHDQEWFNDLAREHGLKFGVERDSWRFIPNPLRATYVRTIASGEPPLAGEPAYIIEHFREQAQEQEIFKFNQGQLIAEKVPARKGARGRNVLDEPVEPPLGDDVALIAGPGTVLSDDGLKLYAEISGYLSVGQEGYAIVPAIEYDETVPLPRVVNFDGVVRVAGSVPRGHVVVASHHVEILGDVQASSVVAGGILHIHGKVSECRATKIQAAGDMYVGSAEKSVLRSGGSILVTGKVSESEIITGGSVQKQAGAQTAFVGGRVLAAGSMEASMIGASPAVSTVLQLGVPFDVRVRYEHTARAVVDLINKFGIINNKLLPLHKKLVKKQITQSEIPGYKKLRLVRDGLAEKIRVHKAVISKLRDVINKNASGITAYVDGTAYPGTVISIGTSKVILDKRCKKCLFSIDPDTRAVQAKEL